MAERFLTVEEAALLKNVSSSTIYAAVKSGRLPHVRVLGRIGIRKADADVWVPMAYAGRPGRRGSGGRPNGTPMSAEAKERISEAQRQRWANRKQQNQTEPHELPKLQEDDQQSA